VRGLEPDRPVPHPGALRRFPDALHVHQPEDEQSGRHQRERRKGRGCRQGCQPVHHDHDDHDAGHVSLDRLFNARRHLHLLDRAGGVRHHSGLLPDHPLPQDLRCGG